MLSLGTSGNPGFPFSGQFGRMMRRKDDIFSTVCIMYFYAVSYAELHASTDDARQGDRKITSSLFYDGHTKRGSRLKPKGKRRIKESFIMRWRQLGITA